MKSDTRELRCDAGEDLVQREVRFDLNTGTLGTRRQTPQGGLIVDANIARVGVLEYRNPDGSIRREYRPAEEVFKRASLDSFQHAPVTVDHPGGLVTPLNWRQHTVGHLGSAAARDGKFVQSDVHVQDAKAVAGVESGDLVEGSCGYQCRIDKTPGTFEGQSYDVIQRDITGNHFAIGPKGWGRSGPEVRLRLDAGESVSGVDADTAPAPAAPLPTVPSEMTEPVKPPVTPATPVAAPATPGADALAGENALLKAENTRLLAEANKRTDANAEAENAKRMDAAVQARVALVTQAAPVMAKDWKADGKSDDAIRREVLAKLEPTLALPEAKADGAEGFVFGAYAAAVSRADRATKALHKTRDASPAGGNAETKPVIGGKREDAGGTGDAIADSANAMVARSKDAWKKPKADKRGGT